MHPLKVCSNRTKWFFTAYKNQSASQVNVHVSYTFAEKPWPRLLAVLLEVNILGLESGLKTSHPLKIFSNPTKYRFLFFQAMVINIQHQKVNASFTHKQRNLFHMLSVSLGVL